MAVLARLALAALLLRGASSTPVGALDPQGVHLALGDADDEMVIAWHTLGSCARSVATWWDPTPARGASPPPAAPRRAPAATTAFVDGGPERVTRHVHVATLRGLAPGATYAYRVECEAPPNISSRLAPRGEESPSREIRRSSVFSFRAKRSPAQIAAGPPLKLLAFCDAGHLDSARVLSAVLAEVRAAPEGPPDAILHCGDLAYDMDSSDGRVGDAFSRDLEPIASSVPYMVSPGNHERAYNFSHYKARFAMPGEGGRRGGSENHYYSFEIGPARVVAYNSEAFFWPEFFDDAYRDRMVAWLDEDLRRANARRDAAPWIIAHAHRPMYCAEREAGTGRCGWEFEAARLGARVECGGAYRNARCAAAAETTSEISEAGFAPRGTGAEKKTTNTNATQWPMEALLFEHAVDLAFFGHVHDYERFYPTYDRVVTSDDASSFDTYADPRATAHVTTGSGGNKEMRASGTAVTRGACEAPWCAFQSGHAPRPGQSADHTFSRVLVPNATTLVWEQLSANDVFAHPGEPPKLIDRFEIRKTYPPRRSFRNRGTAGSDDDDDHGKRTRTRRRTGSTDQTPREGLGVASA